MSIKNNNAKASNAKAILILALAISSSDVSAEWSEINSDENGTQYIDLDRTKRNGHLVKIWTAIDYKRPAHLLGKNFNSVVIQEEYDYNNELRHTIFVSAYSGNMASGRAVLIDSKVTNWSPIPPGSSGELFLNIACNSK